MDPSHTSMNPFDAWVTENGLESLTPTQRSQLWQDEQMRMACASALAQPLPGQRTSTRKEELIRKMSERLGPSKLKHAPVLPVDPKVPR